MSEAPQNSATDDYARQFMPPERRARLATEQSASSGRGNCLGGRLPTCRARNRRRNRRTPAAATARLRKCLRSPQWQRRCRRVRRPIPRAAAAPAPAPEPWPAADDEDETAPAYVEANDLFKIYKPADLEVVALRGVDLEVRSGELIGIVGASGSGKTTLLNILAGLERPRQGRIRVGDRDLLDITDQDLVAYRRREVGFVWQATGRNLVPYLSVRDNIELPQAIAGAGKRSAANAPRNCWKRCRCPTSPAATRRSCPAESSSAWPSPLPWPTTLHCSWLTNPPGGARYQHGRGRLPDVAAHQPAIRRDHHHRHALRGHRPLGGPRGPDRDGRIGSESYLMSSYRGDEGREEEYLVVDRAGRLQLPREYVEQLSMEGLATAGMDEDAGSITLRPASAPHRSRERWETVADN